MIERRYRGTAAFLMVDRLATKLEELGYLDKNSSYEEFEIVVNQFIQTVDNALERDHMEPAPITRRAQLEPVEAWEPE